MSFLTMNLVIINDRPDPFVLFSTYYQTGKIPSSTLFSSQDC